MSINNNANNQNLNQKRLIELSNNLGKAYLPGLDNTKSKGKDSWDAQKFIAMSRYLSSAYGVDF